MLLGLLNYCDKRSNTSKRVLGRSAGSGTGATTQALQVRNEPEPRHWQWERQRVAGSRVGN